MIYSPPFWAMALANLAHTASFTAFFLLPLYILEQGGDQGDIGILMGVFTLASALFRPWIADMIDRLGRKRSYTLGTLIVFGLPFFYLLLDDPLGRAYPLFLLIRILHGIGMATCFTAVFTYIGDLLPANRLNEGIGMFGISGLVGIALGPFLTEMALDRYGFAGLFVTASALGAVALLAHLPLKESFRSTGVKGPSFFALLKQRKLLTVGLLAVLFGIGIAGTSNFVAPLAEQRGLSLISVYFINYSAGAIMTRIVGGRLADLYGETRILPYGIVIYAAGMLLLPLAASLPYLAVMGVFAGIGHGILFPSLNSMAIRDQPAELRGKLTGIFTGGIDSGAFAGSLTLGYIGQWLGLNALFLFAGALMLTGVFLFRFPRGR